MEILNCIDFCKIYITFFLDNKTTFLFAKTKVHPQEAINNKKPQQMSGVWSERKDKNDYTNTTKKKCTSPCPFLAKYSISSTSTSFTMLQGTGGPTLPAVLKKKKKTTLYDRPRKQAWDRSIDWTNKRGLILKPGRNGNETEYQARIKKKKLNDANSMFDK